MIYKALDKITQIPHGWKFHCTNFLTGEKSSFYVSSETCDGRDVRMDAEAWRDGKLVQNAFPYLYPSERELLITGMLPEDWENMDDLGE